MATLPPRQSLNPNACPNKPSRILPLPSVLDSSVPPYCSHQTTLTSPDYCLTALCWVAHSAWKAHLLPHVSTLNIPLASPQMRINFLVLPECLKVKSIIEPCQTPTSLHFSLSLANQSYLKAGPSMRFIWFPGIYSAQCLEYKIFWLIFI